MSVSGRKTIYTIKDMFIMSVSGRKTIYTIKEMFKKSVMVLFVIFFSLPSRVFAKKYEIFL